MTILIGSLLRSLRLSSGMTQKEISEGIICETSYSKIEREKQRVYVEEFLLLLIKLQCEEVELHLNDKKITISIMTDKK